MPSLFFSQAHLKQFTGMYGLFVALILFTPRLEDANELPLTTGALYGRIVTGLLLVVGIFILITELSPKSPSWLMHLCRAIRYASVPFVTFFFSPSAFRVIRAL